MTLGSILTSTAATAATDGILQARRIVDMSDTIMSLDPDIAPLTVFSHSMKKKVATNPKFDWMEIEHLPNWDSISHSGGYNPGDIVLVVAHAAYFKATDTVKVPRTAEVMRVLTVNLGAGTITVDRSIGATPAAALNDSEPLLIMANAQAEFAGAPDIRTVQPTNAYNYLQNTDTAFGASGDLIASDLYGGPEQDLQRRENAFIHLEKIEKSIIFGERSEDLTGAKPIRTTGGILEFITTNITPVGGALSQAAFEIFLRNGFRYSNAKREKLFICSRLLVSVISTWANARLMTVQKDKTFGLNITEYVSPHGRVLIMPHYLFEGATYGGMGILTDMTELTFRFGKGRDTRLLTGVQLPDEDGIKDMYRTSFGLEFGLEKKHSLITGVTGAI